MKPLDYENNFLPRFRSHGTLYPVPSLICTLPPVFIKRVGFLPPSNVSNKPIVLKINDIYYGDDMLLLKILNL